MSSLLSSILPDPLGADRAILREIAIGPYENELRTGLTIEEQCRSKIIALLTPWLVQREAASRRRIEELRSDTKRLSDDACANWRKAHAAEAALAQLRREAQALVDELTDQYATPKSDALRITLARLPVNAGGNQ